MADDITLVENVRESISIDAKVTSGILQYQWQSSTDNINWSDIVSDGTTYTATDTKTFNILTPDNLVSDEQEFYVRCRLFTATGLSLNSESAQIFTEPIAITIVTDLNDDYDVNIGVLRQLDTSSTVNANSLDLTYEWQISPAGANRWAAISSNLKSGFIVQEEDNTSSTGFIEYDLVTEGVSGDKIISELDFDIFNGLDEDLLNIDIPNKNYFDITAFDIRLKIIADVNTVMYTNSTTINVNFNVITITESPSNILNSYPFDEISFTANATIAPDTLKVERQWQYTANSVLTGNVSTGDTSFIVIEDDTNLSKQNDFYNNSTLFLRIFVDEEDVTVSDYVGETRTVTLDSALSVTPNTSSLYDLKRIESTGSTLTAVTNTTVFSIDTSEDSTDDAFNGYEITINSEDRIVTAYDGSSKTVTINEALSTLPTTSDSYTLKEIVSSGKNLSAVTNTTVFSIDTSEDSTDDTFNDYELTIKSFDKLFSKIISDYESSSRTITFDTALTETPNTSSQYSLYFDVLDHDMWNDLSSNSIYQDVTNKTLKVIPPNIDYNGYRYRCKFSEDGVLDSSYSNSAVLIVKPTQIKFNQTPDKMLLIEQNLTYQLTSNTYIIPVSFYDGVEYQWQISTDDGSSWSNLSDNTRYLNTQTKQLTFIGDISLNTNRYRIQASSPDGISIFSDSVVYFNVRLLQYSGIIDGTNETKTIATLLNNIISPVIELTFVSGTTKTIFCSLNINAEQIDGLTLKWQISTDNGSSWSDLLAPSSDYFGIDDSLSLQIITKSSFDNYKYRLKITNTSNPNFITLYSDVCTLVEVV